MEALKCEMRDDCTRPVTHLDDSGFIYCEGHGIARREWKRCRKLRAHELSKLRQGKRLAAY